jgi:hypothetical protein
LEKKSFPKYFQKFWIVWLFFSNFFPNELKLILPSNFIILFPNLQKKLEVFIIFYKNFEILWKFDFSENPI